MTKQPITKKKLLHVLHILYDILSALFIVLVSGALIINACRTNEEAKDVLIPNVQEVKGRRDAIKGEGRSVSFTNDIISSDFLTTIVYSGNFVNDYISNQSHNTKSIFVGEGYSNGHPTYPRVSWWSNVNFNDMTVNGNEDVTWAYLYEIYIVASGYNHHSAQNIITIDFTVHFRDDLEDDILSYVTTLFIYGDTFTLDNNSFSFTGQTITTHRSFLNSGSTAIVYSNNRAFDTYLNAMSNDDYQKGYELGKESGYNIGYVDGSRGIESNAFTVIGQAFEAVTNIFSIEVLPSLPLWVLVFTPLIIAVVIVVVKLIKG